MKGITAPLGHVALLGIAAISASSCAPTANRTATLLAFALESRVMAQDIPDFGLLPNDGPILVLLPDGLRVGLDRPKVDDRSLVSTTLEELRSRAVAQDESISFIHVGTPRQQGDAWVIDMGVDYVSPEPDKPKDCCCAGSALFAGEGRSFRFLRWEQVICS